MFIRGHLPSTGARKTIQHRRRTPNSHLDKRGASRWHHLSLSRDRTLRTLRRTRCRRRTARVLPDLLDRQKCLQLNHLENYTGIRNPLDQRRSHLAQFLKSRAEHRRQKEAIGTLSRLSPRIWSVGRTTRRWVLEIGMATLKRIPRRCCRLRQWLHLPLNAIQALLRLRLRLLRGTTMKDRNLDLLSQNLFVNLKNRLVAFRDGKPRLPPLTRLNGDTMTAHLLLIWSTREGTSTNRGLEGEMLIAAGPVRRVLYRGRDTALPTTE